MSKRGPDFLIIGAQKRGTTWLWRMLEQHPQTDLGVNKELFFFDRVSSYERGLDYYRAHFAALDGSKVTGEATATYFYDRIRDEQRRPLPEHPPIPELVMDALPDVKILLILRDPVHRAISAYKHHMRRRRYSPSTSLTSAIEDYPHLRIRELGDYRPYLALWQSYVPAAQFRTFIFERDVRQRPDAMMGEVHQFLGLDRSFRPTFPERRPNAAWGWTHIVLQHRLGPWYGTLYSRVRRTPLRALLDWMAWWEEPPLDRQTLQELRTHYLRQKPGLEARLGRSLPWDYGASLLRASTLLD